MGAQVTTATAATHPQATGHPLPGMSSQDTGATLRGSRDERGSSSLAAGGGETGQALSQLEVKVNLGGDEMRRHPRAQA